MSRLLIQLLRVKERDFQSYIQRLEHVTLFSGVDIRLSSELLVAARKKAHLLGVSEIEHSQEDLYAALLQKLAQDDVRLQKKLKLETKTDPELTAKRIASAVTLLSKHERVLCLSSAATKRLLKAAPPAKTLKLLKLRSLDSVMKRFDPRMLYAVSCLVESKSWRSQVHAKMKRASGKDIVWEATETLHMPVTWYEKLQDLFAGRGFYHANKETGVLLVMPVIHPERSGSTTLAMSLLLQSSHLSAMESLSYKRRSFIRGRAEVLPEIAHGLQPQLQHIHGLLPSWPVVYQLFAEQHVSAKEYDVELLLGDLEWNSVEAKLTKLVPDMVFWQGSHYLAVTSRGKPVSMHIVDVASSLVGRKSFGEQHTAHVESSLWNELQLRYLKHNTLTEALMKQVMSDEELVLY